MKRIVAIGGDGIGPEVVGSALTVLESLGVPLDVVEREAGLECRKRRGSYLPKETMESCLESDAILFGAITSPLPSEDPHYESVIVRIRKALDLYANVRPFRDLGQRCLQKGIDLVLIRENTEDVYLAPEVEDEGGVTTHRRISREGSRRISRFAFEYATRRGRKRVDVVHKANVLRKSDGLFRKVFFDEGSNFPDLQKGEVLVDSAAYFLVRDPGRFDVLVTTNLYGDILSDELAGVVGGLGFAPSGSFGPSHALFEPVHGSAPDIAGKGIANPVGAILSLAMMLEYLGFLRESRRVEEGVVRALEHRTTPDAGGGLKTEEFTDLVLRNL